MDFDFGGPPAPPPTGSASSAVFQKDQEVEAKHREMKANAQEAIARMGAERQRKIDNRKAHNRQAEEDLEADRVRLEEGGEDTKWERVVRMVDLKGDEKKMRKTARMRQIFLYLKNEQ
eukprot:TRINITY_DN5585_c0_g2_i3.p1 TRINITY_DN5585_c0_g2~~TRINITY_DN5585_c0_g2_i3.p1  ORF type:complete len:118 (+),score=43.95 TRINITY_DN5585_c0_g2_i3:106-459(+)